MPARFGPLRHDGVCAGGRGLARFGERGRAGEPGDAARLGFGDDPGGEDAHDGGDGARPGVQHRAALQRAAFWMFQAMMMPGIASTPEMRGVCAAGRNHWP
jgi:hypothetical protein